MPSPSAAVSPLAPHRTLLGDTWPPGCCCCIVCTAKYLLTSCSCLVLVLLWNEVLTDGCVCDCFMSAGCWEPIHEYRNGGGRTRFANFLFLSPRLPDLRAAHSQWLQQIGAGAYIPPYAFVGVGCYACCPESTFKYELNTTTSRHVEAKNTFDLSTIKLKLSWN